MTENLNFVFKNMKPDKELENTAKQILEKILNFAPYDSTGQGKLEKLETGYSASLDLVGPKVRFELKSFDAMPISALNRLTQIFQEKLNAWHQTRFNT